MEESKQMITWKNILPEIVFIVTAAAGIYAHGFFNGTGTDGILRGIVMMALGIAIVGFCLRQEYLNGSLAYNNSRHLLRFWAAAAIGLLMAFVCVFLPKGGWPFPVIFVMLSLYSSLGTGVLAASVLLMLPTLLSGASVGVFFLYFVSGIFAASLFNSLEQEFAIGIPWFLSMLCLLVCETANIVLMANARLNIESFIVPVANLIISSILLLGFLYIFSKGVVYQYRERYLEINDIENPVLIEYRKQNRAEYFLCVHTAYFCERIGGKLLLDVDALKCAGYYHKLYGKPQMKENIPDFPPHAREILQEYQEKRTEVTRKETAVLVCADAIVSTIMLMFSKNKEKTPDYEQVINAVFKKFHDMGSFRNCDITMHEFNVMQKIFKEEKLYYELLR